MSELPAKKNNRELPLPRFNDGLAAVSSLWLFGRELLANPRAVGAICPSSGALARHMASRVPTQETGLVVELGGGTGAVTNALLKRGIPLSQLVVVERSANLAAHLIRRFPGLRVIHGDATQVSELLGPSAGDVRAVVSSLPLRSLPARTVQAIVDELEKVLRPQGLLVQFTYNHRALCASLSERFVNIDSDIVWGNLPPARLDVFSYHP